LSDIIYTTPLTVRQIFRFRRCIIPIGRREGQLTDIIYGDVYFIINFSMDLLALFICGRLRRQTFSARRALFAASAGAGYSVAELYMSGGALPILLSLVLPFLMCYICFGYGSAGRYLSSVLTFWLVSFLMGGIMTALYYGAGKAFGAKRIYINGTAETIYSDIPFPAVLIAAGVCGALTFVWNRTAGSRARAKVTDIEITVGQNRVKTTALCDSGNLLTEPIGGLPVILVSKELEERLIPGGIESQLFCGDPRKIRVIPYESVSGSGIMYGLIPDSIKVGKESRRGCICAGASDLGGFEAIIPAQML